MVAGVATVSAAPGIVAGLAGVAGLAAAP